MLRRGEERRGGEDKRKVSARPGEKHDTRRFADQILGLIDEYGKGVLIIIALRCYLCERWSKRRRA